LTAKPTNQRLEAPIQIVYYLKKVKSIGFTDVVVDVKSIMERSCIKVSMLHLLESGKVDTEIPISI
jgi:hypothetical protein